MSVKQKWYRNRYAILVVTLLITIIGVYDSHKEIAENSAETLAENLENSAQLFSLYTDDFISSRITQLEQTADLTVDTILEDKQQAKKILKEHGRGFETYTILSTAGEKKYDSADIAMNFSMARSEYLDKIVNDKKSVVYSGVVKDSNSEKYLVICSPVKKSGEVIAILAGAVPAGKLSNLMKKWEISQSGCAFLMTPLGTYLSSGERFNEYLDGAEDDFITYLGKCYMDEDSPSVSQITWDIQSKKKISAHYGYDGTRYSLVLLPARNCDLYAGFLLKETGLETGQLMVASKTKMLLVIAAGLWLIILIYSIYLVYEYGRDRERLERYKTISGLEKSLLFELQFDPKFLKFYGDNKKFLGTEVNSLIGDQVYKVYDRIHPEDQSVRGRLHQFFENDEELFSAEVRIRTGQNQYGWFRIMGSLIRDVHTGMNKKFIGKIENATEKITEEKDLVGRAENDLLTGVFNKKTMEDKVTQSLMEVSDGGNSFRIFFMVDLDNFKNVNDKLGHIMGDKAIADTAEVLTDIFHSDAYVGRLGGDEFAVLAMYDAFDEQSLYQFIKNKADKICEGNRRTYSNGGIEVHISSSVGISIAPIMAADFETLYKKADSALYKSKNGGKNCYHIYGKDTE